MPDDEYDPLEPHVKLNHAKVSDFIRKNFGPTQYYDEDSGEDNMEAGFDEIEREERRAEKIAKREDWEELRRIREDEDREKMERSEKKREKKEKRKEK